MNAQNMPLVSVIVPIYRTEEYLEKCLESILAQTYGCLEVICVNDASPDNAEAVIHSYAAHDSRVKLVSLKENTGLFHARLEGTKSASGTYLMFVDSDDHIGIDYVRLLVEAAEEQKADIVKGQFVMDDLDSGEMYTYPYINDRPCLTLHGREIAKRYFEQEGLDFSWHVIWGKLYRMELWKKCEPYYQQIRTHLIMTEDIVFSTPLFWYAQDYVEISCDTYFYVQRKNASTGILKDVEKFRKNIADLKIAFGFRRDFLKQVQNKTEDLIPYHQEIEVHNRTWEERYGRIWKNTIRWAGFGITVKRELETLVKEALMLTELGDYTKEDGYFYAKKNTWTGQEESVKRQIADDSIQTVSFDIFDTLILRPFFEPTDLFRLLDIRYKQMEQASLTDFSAIRIEAECSVRKKLSDTQLEEVTLTDIYTYIRKEFGISANTADRLMKEEKELEVRFCYQRKLGYELFCMAKQLEKEVILSSDMYLDKQCIKAILDKNGYTGYSRLILSSECQMTKSSGTMYRYLLQTYDRRHLIHIGDNVQADVRNAEKAGIRSIYLPKAVSVFRGELTDRGFFAGNSFYSMLRPHGSYFDHKTSLEFFGIRCMLALVANRFFDNPFHGFDKESDFNANAYFMGYYALGMHLFGIVSDLCKKAGKKRVIHFAARDGYACKLIYDQLRELDQALPESNYLYLSRKSMLPLALQKPSDIYYIKDQISGDSVLSKTPRMILEQYLGIGQENRADEYIKKVGFVPDRCFKNMDAFQRFLKRLSEQKELFTDTWEEKQKVIRLLDAQIQREDLLFDIGYNGTAQRILSYVLHKPVEAYYVYLNKDRALVNEYVNGCKIHTFYDRTPLISGPIRELLFSKGEPSCCGYQITENQLVPVFEKDKRNYIEKYLNRVTERAVVDFTNDFLQNFSDYLPGMTFRNHDISIPFEFLMERASCTDRDVFCCSHFEDDIFLGKEKLELTNWWNQYSIRQESRPGVQSTDAMAGQDCSLPIEYQIHRARRWKRALILLLLNPKGFIKKVLWFMKSRMRIL